MIRFRHGIAGFLCAVMSGSFLLSPAKTNAYSPTENRAVNSSFSQKLSQASLFFTENRGQVADVKGNPRPDILFSAHSGHTDLYLTATGISYQFKKIKYPAGYDPYNTTDAEKQEVLQRQATTETYNFSLSLEGGNPHPHILTGDKAGTVFNYYLAQCPNGITNVASYHKLVYEEVYPHIDWVIYSDGNRLKYDFIVKPGGDPATIKLRIKDAAEVSITDKGELLMRTSLGEIKEKKPLSFVNDQPVSSSFRTNSDGTIGFDVAAQPGQTLRIDPAVVWSTYFGGSANDVSFGCASDGNGHIYLSGYAASSGLAAGGYQNTQGGSNDAYLAKFDSSGYLLWATYYGNTGDDQGYGCITDGAGNIYLSGKTNSTTGIATAGATQTSNGGGIDAFLVKFDASGARLWATFYGGTATDQATGAQSVAVDGSGNVFLSGNTSSATNIAAGTGFQNTIGAVGTSDAFLVKFNGSGTRLWGTYYGGSATETGNACAIDGSGNAYLTGQTGSTNITTTGAYQTTPSGSTDAYLAKFDANGGRTWCTYYGNSSGGSAGFTCIADASGNVYLAGNTNATTNLASSGSYQSVLGGLVDAYLVKFNSSGTTRLWGTYYGGSGSDQIRACYIDPSGNVLVSGVTNSTNAIGTGGFQSALAGGSGNDAFVALFSSTGSRIWGSYFGGPGSETGYNAVMDATGNIYMSGQTSSTSGLAIPGTFQSAYGGGTNDAFLVKIGEIGLFTDSVSINLCTGAAVNVPYSLFGVYNSGNTFTAQLSDASGSFASPVNIGSVTSTTAGTISALIPVSTPPGTGYRIRVISSSPVIIGTNNGTNLTIGITTNPTVSLSVSPNDTVCLGTPVTFTATASNAGFTYTWYKGNTSTTPLASGTINDTFSVVPANNDTFIVKISNGCAVPAYDTIVMTVNTPAIPTIVASVSPNDTICSNMLVTFTAVTTNAGTNVPVWYKNGVQVGTGLTYTPTTGTISSNDIFKAVLTSNGNCVSVVPVKDSIKMTVSPALTPSVTLTVSPNDTICAGTTVTFTATPANGGSSPAPTYLWFKNGTQVGTGLTYTPAANSVSNNDVYRFEMTVNDTTGCYSATLIKDSIKMTVNPVVTPTISLQVSPNDTVCAGTIVICTPLMTNTGSGAVNWFVNGTAAGTGANYSFTATTNTWVKAVVTSTIPCATPATVADSVLIVVNPVVTPVVTISANPGNTICAGQQITFTANPLNGGTYDWFKNGSLVGSGNTYSTTTAATNDVFYVVMTSNAPCATVPTDTSNYITMTVNQNVVPGVNITVNAGSTICAGTVVTFQAHTTNGGTPGNLPDFQWYVGNTPSGSNDSTFPVSPVNGDIIHVVMTSSLACAIPDSAISNSITMTVVPQIAPTITITADVSDTACIGKPVTYTITSVSGFNPADTVIWKKGSSIVKITPASTSSFYIDNAPDGSPVSATLHSTMPCANAAYVTSTIILPVKACCDAPANLTKVGLDPTGGIFSWDPITGVVGYEYNATQSTTNPVTGQFTNSSSCVVNTLSPGTYYLYVRTYCGNGVYSEWVRIGPFTLPTTGINTVPGEDYTMMIYPNPVSDMATVEIRGGITRNTVIQITDLSGRVINTTKSKDRKFNIDMRNLASGMYMLRFNDGEHSGAVKINKL